MKTPPDDVEYIDTEKLGRWWGGLSNKGKLAVALIVVTVIAGIVIGVAATREPGDAPPDQVSKNFSTERASYRPSTTIAPFWTQVAKYSGSSRKVTTAFTLSGGEARLTYSVSGSRPYLSCFVVPDGQEVDQPGSELAVETKNSGSDATRLMMDPGHYYLYVIAYGCEWTIQIEELR